MYLYYNNILKEKEIYQKNNYTKKVKKGNNLINY